MNRSSTPGSPAGRHAGPRVNRARSIDYTEEEQPDETALVPGPGHGRVGVFQAPRPGPARPVEPAGPPPLAGDGTDIDSPFLDLFGGARPSRAALPAPPAARRP
ncbi:hypothetical protein K7640_15305, partial [Micromonospora sp. PLK6-60]|uniref:hypothetical protein n=1 Tax=Micromonospora sp. PLK6-60 TaxID=2873383 RepID=UPI001CA67F50